MKQQIAIQVRAAQSEHEEQTLGTAKTIKELQSEAGKAEAMAKANAEPPAHAG